MIRPNSLSNDKVVFALLTKVLIVYVKPITIAIRKLGLEEVFSCSFFNT